MAKWTSTRSGSAMPKTKKTKFNFLLFFANIVSAILMVVFILSDVGITGYTIAPTNLKLSKMPAFAIFFVMITLMLDVYFYIRGRMNK
jgi:hypothetical protein